jgi:hypothetical protein
MSIELAEHRCIDCRETIAKVAEYGLVVATVDNHGCGVVVQMVEVAEVLAHVHLKRLSCVVGRLLGCVFRVPWLGWSYTAGIRYVTHTQLNRIGIGSVRIDEIH